MLVSVVVPTIRYGGLDTTFQGLGNQTFSKDMYEVIIIDDLPESREKEVKSYSEKCGVKIKYSRSKTPFWKGNEMIANARNTGLLYAEGKLVVFIDDYTYVKPDFLERHYKVYGESCGKFSLIGQLINVQYVPPQKRPADISVVPRKTVKRRTSDGTEQPWEDFRIVGGKVIDAHWGWWWTCNASAPLDKIVEVNGFDEEYDGCTAGEDMDLAMRLSRVGCHFTFDPECKAWHMDHDNPQLEPSLRFPEIKTYRTDSRLLLARNQQAQSPIVNAHFNLKEERHKLGYT